MTTVDLNRYVDALARELDNRLPGQVNVIPQKDPGTTGNFEVRIAATNQLIHSKKTLGHGKAESKAEVDAIVQHIEEYLKTL
eukprot:gene33717-40792_t